MVSIVLLGCYQYHRCYDHIWLQTVKSFKDTVALKVTIAIYLLYNLCRFAIVLGILSTNIFAMISLCSFKVTLNIYLFYNFCTSYHYYKCYNHVWAENHNVIQWHFCLEGEPYYVFILQSLYICPCTRYKCVQGRTCTKYKHICILSSSKVINTIYLS